MTKSRSDEVRAPADVLGYLVKHVHSLVDRTTDEALAPHGITGRDLGVLRVIAAGGTPSQQELATVIGVDRTSMVALVDTLERLGAVERLPSEQDRRRNVVRLTKAGRQLYRDAEAATVAAERDVLGVLGKAEARRFRSALRELLASDAESGVRRQGLEPRTR